MAQTTFVSHLVIMQMMMETLKTDSKKIRKKSSKYGIRRGISLCGCYDTKEKQEKKIC